MELSTNYSIIIHDYYVAFKNWHLRNASQLRSLTSHMIVTPAADNICNQFEPRSGPNPHSNFDTLMVFLELA